MIVPMLCGDSPESMLTCSNMILQRKYDGTRCIVYRDETIRMIGRSFKNDYSNRYPQIINDIRKLPHGTILDGELTFFQGDLDCFQTALATDILKQNYTIKLMVFDVLQWEGKLLTHLPTQTRITFLGKLPQSTTVVPVESYTNDFLRHYKFIAESGGEGVVLKKSNAPYVEGEPGRKHWFKIKATKTTDCFVCGITKGKESRSSTFGALILGQTDENGKIRFVGKCSGFNNEILKALNESIRIMPGRSDYIGSGISDAIKFVDPTIIVEVEYLNKTDYGMLRQPRFLKIKNGDS